MGTMGIHLALAAFVFLYSSYSGVSAMRSTPSADPQADNRVLNGAGHEGDEYIKRLTFLPGNCGRLIVRGGLSVGDSVKVTSNGWAEDSEDFLVTLVSDGTPESRKPRGLEHPASEGESAASTPGGKTPPPSGGGSTVTEPDHGGQGNEELPTVPLVGVRISGEPSEEGTEAPPKKQPVVLVYSNDVTDPTEIPLESPTGPQTPFMIIFTRTSETEMEVTLYTWIRAKTEDKGASGTWHKASAVVGTRSNNQDLSVNINDSSPKTLKVYGSASADLLTAKAGTCNETDSPLVEVQPPHLEGGGEATGGSGTPEPSGYHQAAEMATGNQPVASISEA